MNKLVNTQVHTHMTTHSDQDEMCSDMHPPEPVACSVHIPHGSIDNIITQTYSLAPT